MTTGAADQQTFNNDNRGAMFRNDKGDNPARPDYRGNATIICTHCNKPTRFRISSWVRVAQSSGQKFLSMAYQVDPNQPEPVPAQAGAAPAAQDEDLPF